ncbi:hypothetical protein DFJ58DRAFT_845027 [Suillus subalutaceus]|uniref:uncharacterized protein n=1 Tax=Suillus subalutaceus TaxID=48586 RepID=UPI001B86F3A6|nr:uncharacterized protein DFJ58DRAFT_845027 [Suillus subalutaceus]KAG1841450.1 hypothetical protein DFJ58DRAFT_845027 [Suillus subalutaceus]
MYMTTIGIHQKTGRKPDDWLQASLVPQMRSVTYAYNDMARVPAKVGYLSRPRSSAGTDLSLRANKRGGAVLLAPAHLAALSFQSASHSCLPLFAPTHHSLISNGPHTKQPSPEDKQSQDDNVIQLLGITISAINATKDLVPIDLAKGILGTIANILTVAQAVIKNKSDFQAIADKCETIRDILERATEGATKDDLKGYLGHALTQLNKSVNRINSDVESKKEQRFWHRLLSVTIDRDRITRWEKDLDEVLMLFRGGQADLGPRDNTRGINDTQYRPPAPPSRPPMFYGRGDLVAELTNLVINDEHIALIGPGGMGKSSLAKTILHEAAIMERFANRHYFIPSTITFEAFTTRFAQALGIELSGVNPVQQICACLRSASALVVLDNAETFEEAGGSSALTEIPQAIAEIAGIPGVILILTSRSRRSALNVPWITKDIPPLDSNSAQEAFFRIYRLASRENADGGIANLLRDLEYHPLSINLLANAAQQNGWSPAILLERWKDRHSAVLDHGEGKLQSLSYTMQLSLSSPSIQKLGEKAQHALTVIAFLPQGLNEALSKRILPSTLQIDDICDVLWRQSLVYRQGGFVKMLAPIRHYVRDSLPPPDSTCLEEIRTFYYCTVQQCSAERDDHADIIISDHLNIEHVVASISPKSLRRLIALAGNLAKMFTFTTSADELFVNSLDEDFWGLRSKICHWRAKHFYGGDIVQVKTHLENLLLQCPSTGDLDARRDALEALAEVAFCGGRSSDAMHRLQEIVEMYEGLDPSVALWYAVWKGVVVSEQGHHDLAREIIHKASEPFPLCALPSTAAFLHRSYGLACVELNAGEYDKAVSHFTATIEGCNIQGHLDFKAFSIRGLGEIAFERGDFALAVQRFAETLSLCTEMECLQENYMAYHSMHCQKDLKGGHSMRIRCFEMHLNEPMGLEAIDDVLVRHMRVSSVVGVKLGLAGQARITPGPPDTSLLVH